MPFVVEREFNWKQIKIDKTWGLNTIKMDRLILYM